MVANWIERSTDETCLWIWYHIDSMMHYMYHCGYKDELMVWLRYELMDNCCGDKTQLFFHNGYQHWHFISPFMYIEKTHTSFPALKSKTKYWSSMQKRPKNRHKKSMIWKHSKTIEFHSYKFTRETKNVISMRPKHVWQLWNVFTTHDIASYGHVSLQNTWMPVCRHA